MSKFTLDNFPTSKTGKEMLHRVSPIYDNSYVAKWLYQVMGMELDEIKTLFAEMREQVFTTTVTWGIEYQEHKFSIVPDDKLTLEERRARLYRKKVHKYPLNPKRIEIYFKDAWNMDVEVDETVRPGYIDIDFASNRQFDIVSAIKDFIKLKPSHLSLYMHTSILSESCINIAAIPTIYKKYDILPQYIGNSQIYSDLKVFAKSGLVKTTGIMPPYISDNLVDASIGVANSTGLNKYFSTAPVNISDSSIMSRASTMAPISVNKSTSNYPKSVTDSTVQVRYLQKSTKTILKHITIKGE